MARGHKGRRLALLCVLVALVPLVVQRREGRLPCGAGSVVAVAVVLFAAVPRTAVRLAAALADQPTPATGRSCP
ncbi:hypothetical protein [Saccharothrix sp. Mg75]|uniref:hypothetical protein n=1 Tax=Saccharothrix sp. Mg75 TaxID=3445357 RepID=UPI003EE8B950